MRNSSFFFFFRMNICTWQMFQIWWWVFHQNDNIQENHRNSGIFTVETKLSNWIYACLYEKQLGKMGSFLRFFRFEDEYIFEIISTVLSDMWGLARCHHDSSGQRQRDRCVCGNYRGVILLSSAGNILVGVFISEHNAEITNTILLEAQYGFRQNSNVTGMNFLIRQIQGLNKVSMNLTKAFDTCWKRGHLEDFRKVGLFWSHCITDSGFFHDDRLVLMLVVHIWTLLFLHQHYSLLYSLLFSLMLSDITIR